MALGDTRIVILGGGFAGVYAALHLERNLARRAGFEITLVSSENFLLFTPMLPEVPSSSIEPRHIVSPIRAWFRNEIERGPALFTLFTLPIYAQANHLSRESFGFNFLW